MGDCTDPCMLTIPTLNEIKAIVNVAMIMAFNDAKKLGICVEGYDWIKISVPNLDDNFKELSGRLNT